MKAQKMVAILCRALGVSVVMFLTHRLLPLGARLYSEMEYPSKSQQDLQLFLTFSLIGIAALILVGLFFICFSTTVSKWMLHDCDNEAYWCTASPRDFSQMVYGILGGIFIITLMTQFTSVWIHMIDRPFKENFITFFGIWLQLGIGIYLVLGPARIAEKFQEFIQWGHQKSDFQ